MLKEQEIFLVIHLERTRSYFNLGSKLFVRMNRLLVWAKRVWRTEFWAKRPFTSTSGCFEMADKYLANVVVL